jgi:glycosyltransferase involved in cell wall biosynthesis
LDLSSFAVNSSRRDQMRKALRAELGIPQEAVVVTLIARLVPIKRVDRFLRVAHALRDLTDIRFLIVGDGELREVLQHSAEAVALRDRLVWTGFRRDIPAVCFASDVVMQTSDNEGTPVSLIEAQAAGVPVVSTNVGGAASVVPEERLAAPTDIEGLTHLVRELVVDHPREPSAAIETAAIMRDRYGLPRLITELDRLYRRGLGCRAH